MSAFPLVAVVVLLLGPASGSPPPSGSEIFRNAIDSTFNRGSDMRARITLALDDPKTLTRQREVIVLRKNVGKKGQRYFIYLRGPESGRKQPFLVRKNGGFPHDRWIYSVDRDLVERTEPVEPRERFLGSEFAFEEIIGMDPGREVHERTSPDRVIGGRPCWAVQTRREKGSDVLRTTWVDKETWLIMRTEFLDDTGRKARVFEASGLTRLEKGGWWLTEWTLQDLPSGRRTALKFESIEFDIGIPGHVFEERSLRRPPSKWVPE